MQVFLLGTFVSVFQAWHIHMKNPRLATLPFWHLHPRPHRSLPRQAVGWDRFGVGRVRSLWMSTIFNLFHPPKQGPSSNQTRAFGFQVYHCCTWHVHQHLQQMGVFAVVDRFTHGSLLCQADSQLNIGTILESAQNVYQVNFTWFIILTCIEICNSYWILRAVGWIWNVVLCKCKSQFVCTGS